MANKDILDYLRESPNNTNVNVVKGMIRNSGGDGGDNLFKQFIEGELTEVEDSSVEKIENYVFYCCSTLTTISFPAATSIGDGAFNYCTALNTISFPAVMSIGENAFRGCSALTTANFPEATSVGSYAFDYCSALTTISFPVTTNISGYAFRGCSALTTANFPEVLSIGSSAFRYCSNLFSIYLLGSKLVSLLNANAFTDTPISASVSGVYGSIYVPASLYNSYKTATNWSRFSSRLVSVE